MCDNQCKPMWNMSWRSNCTCMSLQTNKLKGSAKKHLLYTWWQISSHCRCSEFISLTNKHCCVISRHFTNHKHVCNVCTILQHVCTILQLLSSERTKPLSNSLIWQRRHYTNSWSFFGLTLWTPTEFIFWLLDTWRNDLFRNNDAPAVQRFSAFEPEPICNNGISIQIQVIIIPQHEVEILKGFTPLTRNSLLPMKAINQHSTNNG